VFLNLRTIGATTENSATTTGLTKIMYHNDAFVTPNVNSNGLSVGSDVNSGHAPSISMDSPVVAFYSMTFQHATMFVNTINQQRGKLAAIQQPQQLLTCAVANQTIAACHVKIMSERIDATV